jgi:hypothetical protein
MPHIEFIPQQEAIFICPKSFFERFKSFLAKENIHIINCDLEAGSPGCEDNYNIEVSDVDDAAEGNQLISKFNASQ